MAGGIASMLRSELSEREMRVLELRYGLGHADPEGSSSPGGGEGEERQGSTTLDLDEVRAHTLEEVARRLGVSTERVRQLERRALQKLRGPRAREMLLGFDI